MAIDPTQYEGVREKLRFSNRNPSTRKEWRLLSAEQRADVQKAWEATKAQLSNSGNEVAYAEGGTEGVAAGPLAPSAGDLAGIEEGLTQFQAHADRARELGEKIQGGTATAEELSEAEALRGKALGLGQDLLGSPGLSARGKGILAQGAKAIDQSIGLAPRATGGTILTGGTAIKTTEVPAAAPTLASLKPAQAVEGLVGTESLSAKAPGLATEAGATLSVGSKIAPLRGIAARVDQAAGAAVSKTVNAAEAAARRAALLGGRSIARLRSAFPTPQTTPPTTVGVQPGVGPQPTYPATAEAGIPQYRPVLNPETGQVFSAAEGAVSAAGPEAGIGFRTAAEAAAAEAASLSETVGAANKAARIARLGSLSGKASRLGLKLLGKEGFQLAGKAIPVVGEVLTAAQLASELYDNTIGIENDRNVTRTQEGLALIQGTEQSGQLAREEVINRGLNERSRILNEGARYDFVKQATDNAELENILRGKEQIVRNAAYREAPSTGEIAALMFGGR